jgi:NADPH:quinone reductase-like Zn-dependent oxidoreductase
MSKAVRFDRCGGVEVLEVRDVPHPEPGPDQVLVAVRAAGINISEGKMRAGLVREIFPATLAELAEAIAAGDLVVPIQRTYPLDDVRAAFTELEAGHIAGKIVLIP